MRKLIIDAQIFQTPAWHRGMGKYSFDLLRCLVPKLLGNEWSAVEMILSSELECDKDMLARITKELPAIKVIELPLEANEVANNAVAQNNRRVVDNYIKAFEKRGIVDFLILSLMQGEISPTFPSLTKVNKIVLFYDLVPLMFHDMYLANPITRNEYLSKINELVKADIYLAISKTVANDLAVYLGIDSARICSIGGGPAQHAKALTAANIQKPFILMPTGNDLRKNNKRAIQAFELYNKKRDDKYKLIVTSYFKDFQIKELKELSKNVIFTGNVSGEVLSYFYKECEGLLFPTEYEGLGLPILEALEYGKPVACSNIAVFREISETAFVYFDPYSVSEIAASIECIIEHPSVNKQIYDDIVQEYSWLKTADKFIQAILPLKHKAKIGYNPKIAVFSADPSGVCMAGKFIQESYAETARLLDSTFYVVPKSDDTEKRVNYLQYVEPGTTLTTGMNIDPENFDNLLYCLDDTTSSAEVLFAALSNPGVLVLREMPQETVWRAMVKKGLISESRFALEKQMSQQLKQNYFLASLLAKQKSVIVFDAEDKLIVESFSKTINPVLVVSLLKLPTQRPVYDDLLLQKTVPVRRNQDVALANSTDTDFRYNEIIAKTKVMIFENKSDKALVLDALRFGTIPAMSKSFASKIGVPSGAYLRLTKSTDSLTTAHLIADSDEEFEAMSRDVTRYFRSSYSFKHYAERLVDILREPQQDTNIESKKHAPFNY